MSVFDKKPWLKHYPSNVKSTIDINKYDSVVQIFENSCRKYTSNQAFTNFNTTLSYQQLYERSSHFSSYLQHQLKLNKGDRIAIMLPNCLQYPIALFGALQAGLTVVNTNPLYTERELQFQLNDSGAKAIIVMENFAKTLQQVIHKTQIKHVVTTKLGDQLNFPSNHLTNFVVQHIKKLVPPFTLQQTIPFNTAIKLGTKISATTVELHHSDIAFLQYTGGTTGIAKGAMLTHGNMVANMLQIMEWIKNDLDEAQESIVTALPLYHIFSLTANCLLFMEIGSHNILITNPRDFKGFVKTLKKSHFTAITGVNTLFNSLLNTSGFDEINFRPLKITLGGGMAVTDSVARHWKQKTGCTLLEAFGMTETSPAVCINPLNLKEFNHSIGLPIPNTECKLINNDEECGINEEGELYVRGPQVMTGYWNNLKETEHVLSSDQWLRTGDMAKMDENGYFYIVDRIKDMVLVSGFNVYPSEIENIIGEHPGVLEVGVTGEDDPITGEAVIACIVKKHQSLTEEEIKDFCMEKLTAYKRPKKVIFCTELPKTNVGKILRRELKNKIKSN